MTEGQPQGQKPAEGSLAEEFRQLGKNISNALQAVWESPERKRLQQDIANGLNDLGNSLKTEANRLSESETGQRIRSEAQDFRQRVHSGEVTAKVREELLAALQTVNNELGKAVDRMSSSQTAEKKPTGPEPGEPAATSPGGAYGENVQARYGGGYGFETGHDEIHPDDIEAGRMESEGGHHEAHNDDVDAPPPPGS